MKINKEKLSKAAIIVIFIALIRCIAEPFRLQYYSGAELSFTQVKPFLIASLVAAVALLLMFALYLFKKPIVIVVLAIATIGILIAIKYFYLL